MGGRARQWISAAVAWVRPHGWWLVLGASAVAAATTVAVLSTRDSSPGGTHVRGEQLSRPDGPPGSTGTSIPPATTTTPTSTTPAGPTTTTAANPAPTTLRRPVAPGQPVGPGTTTSTTTRATPASTLPPELAPALTATRLLDWSPGLVAQQGADVWAVETLDSGRVARLDPNATRARGRVGSFISGLAPVGSGAWALRSSCPSGTAQLVHVDAAATMTAIVALPQVVVCDPGPGRSSLAASPGALWIATPDPARAAHGILLDVDPATGAVVDRITFAGVPHDVQSDGASVWVTLSDAPSLSPDDLVVQAFDASSRRAGRAAVITSPFGFPIVRDGGIWVGGASGLRRIPQSGGAEQVYPADGPGCGGGPKFGFVAGAVTGRTVWGTRLDVTGSGPTGPVTHASVCRVDIATSHTEGWGPGSLHLVGGDDSGAWLADHALGGLVRWSIG